MSDLPSDKLPKLQDAAKLVKVCRDFYEGWEEVSCEEYLPKRERESTKAYEARVAATVFPNMFSQIVSGVSGLITKKAPKVEKWRAIDFDDVDMEGNSLQTFIKRTCQSSLVGGIEFVAAQSVSLEDGGAGRVYWKRYRFEQFYSYRIGAKSKQVEQMVFKDTFERPKGLFGFETVERYVVFMLGGGQVWFEKDGKLSKQSEWINSLKALPVVAIATGKEKSQEEKKGTMRGGQFDVIPRLYDIAKMNGVLFNFESMSANVLGVVGYPVPVFYGDVDDDEGADGEAKGGVTIGVNDALVFQDKTKEGFEWVEITGDGVAKIDEKIARVKADIDDLAFSLLQKTGNRTVVDAQEDQSKNTSFLGDVAAELEAKFRALLEFSEELAGNTVPSGAVCEFKKEFDDVLVGVEQLKLLREMVRDGDLSRDTLWEVMQVAGKLPKGFDAAKEKGLLEEQPD